MATTGVDDFIFVLASLPYKGEQMTMTGRCPDCWEPMVADSPVDLINALLGHVCEFNFRDEVA